LDALPSIHKSCPVIKGEVTSLSVPRPGSQRWYDSGLSLAMIKRFSSQPYGAVSHSRSEEIWPVDPSATGPPPAPGSFGKIGEFAARSAQPDEYGSPDPGLAPPPGLATGAPIAGPVRRITTQHPKAAQFP
jgi:hypothetical protein